MSLREIVLNLSEVNRLDSIAMGLLVRYAERLGKRGAGCGWLRRRRSLRIC